MDDLVLSLELGGLPTKLFTIGRCRIVKDLGLRDLGCKLVQYFLILHLIKLFNTYPQPNSIQNIQPIASKMSKKQSQASRNPKTKSKQQEKSRDRNIYSHKQFPDIETRDNTQLSFLEKRINDEIKMRQQGEVRLLEMIRYLDETKKSKIPIQFQKLGSKKLLTGNIANATMTVAVQNEQIPHLKAQLAELSSKKELYEEQNNKKLNRLKTEIEQIKHNSHSNEIEELRQEFFNFMEQFNQFRLEIEENVQLMGEKIQNDKEQKERQRQKEEERQRERQEERQREIERVRQKERQKAREEERLIERQKERQKDIEREAERQKERQMQRQRQKQREKEMEKIREMQIERQRQRENERQKGKQMQTLLESLYEKIDGQGIAVSNLGAELGKFVDIIGTIAGMVKELESNLANIDGNLQRQLEKIESTVQKSSQSIIATKQSLEKIVYGRKEGTNEAEEKIRSLIARLESNQRRVDLIYKEYLAGPVKSR